jgi:hypothetical protein
MIEKEIAAMTSMQKFQIWWHYYMKMLILKHNFYIRDNQVEKCGFGTPYRHYRALDCSIYKLWLDTPIKTYEEFVSDSNIHPNNYFGIYDWYPKFRNEIQIINP